MTKWGFLNPWSAALRPHASSEYAVLGPDSLVRGVNSINVQLRADMRLNKVHKIREAIELLGRALRVDVSLWSAIPMKARALEREHQTRVDPSQFRDEDLHPHFALVWDSHDMAAFQAWLNAVRTVLSVQEAHKSEAFETALADLLRADVFAVARPANYRVPVSMQVQLWDVPSTEAFVAMLQAALASWSPALHLTHVDLGLSMLDSEVAEALLGRLDSLGVRLGAVSVANAEAVGGHAPVRLLRLQSPRGNRLADELCAALAQGVRGIYAKMHPSDMVDWLLFLRAASLRSTVRHLEARLPNLLRESVLTPASLEDLNRATRVAKDQSVVSVQVNTKTEEGEQLTTTLAKRGLVDEAARYSALLGTARALLLLPPGGVIVVPRSSFVLAAKVPTEQVSVRREGQDNSDRGVSVDLSMGLCAPEGMRALVTMLGTCFGSRLTSLSVRVVRGVVFTQDTIASIVEACPALICLKLSHTELTTMDVFLDAYRVGRCRLQVLSIDSRHVGFITFFEELGNPASALAMTLRELKIGFPQGTNDDEEAYLSSVESMLEQNARLQFLELRLFERRSPQQTMGKRMSMLMDSIVKKLRRFHRTPLAVCAPRPMPGRAKLAFIGIATGRTTSGSLFDDAPVTSRLGSDIVAMVLAFAAPSLLRVVHVTYESSLGVRVAKACGGTSYSEHVESQLLYLS